MAVVGRILRYNWTYEGKVNKLFAKEGQVDDLIGGLTNLGVVNPAPQTVAVGGHTRRRYPGGPAIGVSAFSRTTLLGGEANRRTLPGQNAYLEVETTTGTTVKKETTTITFTGSFTDLYRYVLANALTAMVLRSPDGTPYEVTVSGD
jgi:hypothetical protein